MAEHAEKTVAAHRTCPKKDAAAAPRDDGAEPAAGAAGTQPDEPGPAKQDGDAWIAAVDADDLPDLHFYTIGLRHDYDTVLSGLTLPWSSGAVEGNVN